MSWIVNPYFLNLRPLYTLHPLFFGLASPSLPQVLSRSFFIPAGHPAFRARLSGPVDRSESCLMYVIRV
ncbi:hypothetical protein MF4836_07835 [Pseudomonas sp. MF4836]|nr:hypothetical protein MF4836_07835 [Pseudomonas sp. MF4836]